MARIMLVEDEPITAMDLERMLVAIGHEVAGWSDAGEEAIQKAKEVHPDLVLMDIRLQGAMTGIEAADQIRDEARARGESTPVVFLTAFADAATVDSACKTSPYGYLVKPFTERSVAAVVQVALARAEEEREIRERERFLASALRSLGEALIAVDARGKVRFANALALELVGRTEEEVVERDADEVIAFAELEDDRRVAVMREALEEGRVDYRVARLHGAGGRVREVRFSAAPMLGPDGSILGGVLAFREETPPRPRELEGEPLPEEGLSERIQHEINSPLTYNLGALSIAIREIDTLRAMRLIDAALREPAREEESRLAKIESLIRSAHEGASRIATVMRELRSSAFLELERVPVKPVEILELALGACADRLATVQIARDVQPARMVRANKWQLAKLLADALKQALSGEAGGETLVVRAGPDERGYAELQLELRAAPGGALGPVGGSSAEAARTLEAHQAELEVTEERGARRITLRLPPLAGAGHRRAGDGGQRGTVLVVDDEPMIGRVLELMLGPHHDVTAVHSAAGAIELLEAGSEFDVVLCDLQMPEMSGRELYERLLETRPKVAERMVFISGGARDARDAAFLERMSGRRLDKPFRADELLPLLAERVGGAHAGG